MGEAKFPRMPRGFEKMLIPKLGDFAGALLKASLGGDFDGAPGKKFGPWQAILGSVLLCARFTSQSKAGEPGGRFYQDGDDFRMTPMI